MKKKRHYIFNDYVNTIDQVLLLLKQSKTPSDARAVWYLNVPRLRHEKENKMQYPMETKRRRRDRPIQCPKYEIS